MKRILIIWGAMLGFNVTSFSQIEGDVMDPKDKGIPNAILIATDSTRNIADTVKSDNRGFYFFTNLKPGKYKIEVKAAGFQPAVLQNIVVKEEDTGVVDDDMYNGQRLDIILIPAKPGK